MRKETFDFILAALLIILPFILELVPLVLL
jgi:hypothetical protein